MKNIPTMLDRPGRRGQAYFRRKFKATAGNLEQKLHSATALSGVRKPVCSNKSQISNQLKKYKTLFENKGSGT